MIFNILPEIKKPAKSTINLTVSEDSAILQELSFVDYDSSMVTIITNSEGILSYELWGETKKLDRFNPFTPYGTQIPVEQYAKDLVGFFSTWYYIELKVRLDKGRRKTWRRVFHCHN